ncbi:MAG TPA: MFS transporter, partial [Caulobacteraceae bacterium]|nr:MFS transporter [Caulobacteraceae bacterium]
TLWPLAVAAAAMAAGRLADRAPAGWLCAAGATCLAAGLAAAAAWTPGGEPRLLALCCVLCGLGFGLFQTPNNRTLFLSAPPERSGAAGGLQGLARLTGQTAGGLVVTLLFSVTDASATPHLAFAIGAALALAAALASVLRAAPETRVSPA